MNRRIAFWLISRLLVSSVVLLMPVHWLAAPTAHAAEPTIRPGNERLVAHGWLVALEDGALLLRLSLSDREREALRKSPMVRDGFPNSPGVLGRAQGEYYVRYTIAPTIVDAMTALVGQKVALELDARTRVVTGGQRVP